jgi:hypothetical protein
MIFLIFAYAAGAQLVLGTNPTLVTSPKSDPAGASDIGRIGALTHIDRFLLFIWSTSILPMIS